MKEIEAAGQGEGLDAFDPLVKEAMSGEVIDLDLGRGGQTEPETARE